MHARFAPDRPAHNSPIITDTTVGTIIIRSTRSDGVRARGAVVGDHVVRTALRQWTAVTAASLMLAVASLPRAEAMPLAQPGHVNSVLTEVYLHNYFGFYDDPTAPPLYIPPGCRQVFTPDGHARAVCPTPPRPTRLDHRYRHHKT